MKKTLMFCGVFLVLMSGCTAKEEASSKTNNTSKETSTSSILTESTTKETETSTSTKESKTKKASTPASTTESSKKKEVKKTEVNGHLFTPNPEDDNEEVSYQSSGDGNISAFVPDYSQYNKEEVISMLGEPSQIITDSATIRDRLEDGEWQLIKQQFDLGKLSEEQAKAFMFATKDLSLAAAMSMELELLVYEDQGKPNVYLSEDSVKFITPMTDYIDFIGKIDTL
ncbi:hypothetical protein UAY_00661 [Enterococcus moraviensis ATCC BAA-383]|uniref:DUF4947 domain-containing protein n=1 Tax=Enterococcus moraviensis ATCC BAA-383 TaxID=1158609 RepID=R2R7R6_9ENTE|nr:DUF4947 domain-containing protein [Enterococcus moraviensis]EOI04960.1 hypothetical protein UAY_00661 [Enterococcus moraviensis ATCC BAA-383]EOT63968.1 hypothetical protein I586_03402 [Enterococcus moraviensis ATCC BAA-383]OJG65363.1 hypothetical protein RV09_GL001219 [Enterococcus moraviensis]